MACRHDTVIGTLAAIGTMKSTPDRPAASTFTPGGGAVGLGSVVPVNSAATLTSCVAISGAASSRSSLVSFTASVFSGAQAGSACPATGAAHTSRHEDERSRAGGPSAGEPHVPTRSIGATVAHSDTPSAGLTQRAAR